MSEFVNGSLNFMVDSTATPCTISSLAISNSSTFIKWVLSGKKESYNYILEERKEILNSKIISLWVTTEPLEQVKQPQKVLMQLDKYCLHGLEELNYSYI